MVPMVSIFRAVFSHVGFAEAGSGRRSFDILQTVYKRYFTQHCHVRAKLVNLTLMSMHLKDANGAELKVFWKFYFSGTRL
jgi:hypothetical protein